MTGKKISQLPVATSVTSDDLFPIVDVGTNTTQKATLSQLLALAPSGTVTSVAVSGGTTGLTTSGGPITSTGTITLGGTLDVDNGGTGRSTLTANNVLVGNGTGQVSLIPPSTAGDVLTWNGTAWVSAPPTGGGGGVTAVSASAPLLSSGGASPDISLTAGTSPGEVLTWSGTAWAAAAPSGAGVATVTASAPLASSGGANPDISLTGTVAIANGGTGQTTASAAFNALAPTTTKGDLIASNGTDNVRVPVGTNGNVLVADSTDAEGLVWSTVNLASASAVSGVLPLTNGGTGQTTKVAAFDALSPATTKGDIIAYNGTDNVRVPVGTNGQVLVADSTDAEGLVWGTVNLTSAVSGTLPLANGGTGQTSYTDGQLLIGNSTGNTLTKATLTEGSGVSITNGAGTITIAATNTGTIGGTIAANQVAVGSGTDTITGSSALTFTSGSLLVNNGANAVSPLVVQDNGTAVFTIAEGGAVTAQNSSNSVTAFQVQNAAGTTLFDVDTSNSRVGVGITGAGLTHTFNIGSGASSNFCVASGGRIHTYDGSAPTNGQVLIGDTALGNFAKATLTQGHGITVTNAPGAITISLPTPGTADNVLKSNGTAWVSGSVPAAGGNSNAPPLLYPAGDYKWIQYNDSGSLAKSDSLIFYSGSAGSSELAVDGWIESYPNSTGGGFYYENSIGTYGGIDGSQLYWIGTANFSVNNNGISWYTFDGGVLKSVSFGQNIDIDVTGINVSCTGANGVSISAQKIVLTAPETQISKIVSPDGSPLSIQSPGGNINLSANSSVTITAGATGAVTLNGNIVRFYSGASYVEPTGFTITGSTLTLSAASTAVQVTADGFQPQGGAGGGIKDLGSATSKWKDIYATNGTIITSDARKKTDIIDLEYGLTFISKLRPVSFKMKDYTVTTRTPERPLQKVTKRTEQKSVEKVELVDGRWVKRVVTEDEEVEDFIFEVFPLYDESGSIIGEHKVPVMEPPVVKETTITHTRKHWGLIAQEVKQALGDDDAALFIYNQEADMYALRYEEIIPALIKSCQELEAKNKNLEARLAILESQ